MRSAIYSLFTTLLLLIPIAAVPFMAVFGVPQFTPVVASPLDETEDEEWDKPAKKKPRTPSKSARSDEADLEFPPDDNWNWDETPKERPRPSKKHRPDSRIAQDDSPSEQPKRPGSAKTAPKSKTPVRPKPGGVQPIPNTIVEDEQEIVQVAHEASEDDNFFAIDTAAHAEPMDDDEPMDETGTPAIPGYRRPRSEPTDDDERADKNASRPKRNAAEQLTWKKAVERLNELGIRNFRLEPGVRSGEFTFTCSYTPSNTPHVTRKFESEADDPLKAVAKVLAQVEEASQQRVLAAPRRSAVPKDRRGPE